MDRLVERQRLERALWEGANCGTKKQVLDGSRLFFKRRNAYFSKEDLKQEDGKIVVKSAAEGASKNIWLKAVRIARAELGIGEFRVGKACPVSEARVFLRQILEAQGPEPRQAERCVLCRSSGSRAFEAVGVCILKIPNTVRRVQDRDFYGFGRARSRSSKCARRSARLGSGSGGSRVSPGKILVCEMDNS